MLEKNLIFVYNCVRRDWDSNDLINNILCNFKIVLGVIIISLLVLYLRYIYLSYYYSKKSFKLLKTE